MAVRERIARACLAFFPDALPSSSGGARGRLLADLAWVQDAKSDLRDQVILHRADRGLTPIK